MQFSGQRARDVSSCRGVSARRFNASLVVSTVLVTVLAGVASAAAGIALPAQVTGWVTYTGAGGVTFQHPSSWTVSHTTTGPLYVFIDPAGRASFRRNINLVLQTSAEPLTAAGYLEIDLGQIRQDHGTITQQHAVSFDGTPGYRVVWTAKVSGSTYELLSQWTIRHGEAWLFTFTSDPARFGSVLPIVERLLASLKLPV